MGLLFRWGKAGFAEGEGREWGGGMREVFAVRLGANRSLKAVLQLWSCLVVAAGRPYNFLASLLACPANRSSC